MALKNDVSDKAKELALNIFMSKYPRDISASDVLEHLSECNDDGITLSDEYETWQPFERYTLDNIVGWISDAADDIESSILTLITGVMSNENGN